MDSSIMLMPLIRIATILGIGLAALGTTTASATDWERNGPSFDCRKASSSIEKKICSSAPLSALDGQIALRYRNLLKGIDKPSADKLRKDQQWFIATRNASADDPNGLVVLMRERLGFLNMIGWSAPAGIEGEWTNNAGKIVVSRDRTGALHFQANAAEPSEGRWVCEAIGTLSSAGAGAWKEVSNDPADQMQFRRVGVTLNVEEAKGASSPNCGLNGTLAGSYFRTGD